jgi:hypothetical protein
MAELKLIQASATLPFPFPDPIEVFDRLLPSHFETQFLVRSPNSVKNWAVELSIRFGKAGTPYAEKIIIHGLTSDTSLRIQGSQLLPFRDLEGIQRWQNEEVFKNQTELVSESVVSAIQCLAYKGNLKKHKKTLSDMKNVKGWGDLENLENWGIPMRILNGEFQLFQREQLNSKERSEIRRKVQALTDRRALSREELKELSRIYRAELKNAESAKRKERPVVAVADYFGILHKTAEYRIYRAREEGFLEPIKKVSAKKQKAKRGKKGTVNAK